MKYNTLLFEKDQGVATITFNRPKQLNAINAEMANELLQLLDVVEQDDEIRCVILTGGEKAFVAGGDVAYMAGLSHLEAGGFAKLIHTLMNRIEGLSKPVIAAISRFALGGGCELALCCDVRIATQGTSFGVPEINLALIPGAGGTQRLARTVGIGWAKRMALTGSPIDADTALKIGLVTQVVEKDELMTAARSLAVDLASKAPVTMRQLKACLNQSMYTDLRSGLEYEQQAFQFLFSTEDETEGVNAFVEKRKAQFKGR